MNKDKIIRRSLLLCGYDINSLNIDKDSLYTTANELLDMLELDLQKYIGLSSNIKVAILTPVVDSKNNMYNDILLLHPEAKIYSLPNDFIEYVGGTSSKVNAKIIGDSIMIYDKDRRSIFTEVTDNFEFEYRARLSIEELPTFVEGYASILLAKELLLLKRPDDNVRMTVLREKEAKEEDFLRNNMSLRTEIITHRNSTYGGWR